MPSIYIAASITTLFGAAVFASLIWHKTKQTKSDRPFLLLAAVLIIPMSPLMFYLVRLPIDAWLRQMMGAGNSWYHALTTLYAPLTEEPAKLWPLLIPWFYNRVTRQNAALTAMALGAGFAIGEIWFLAESLSHLSIVAATPWYLFGGFLGERFILFFIHSASAAIALVMIRKRLWLGLLGAIIFHYFVNFPIFLSITIIAIPKIIWQQILSIWVIVYFFFSITLLARFSYGAGSLGKFLFGQATCPECQKTYNRPFWGMNFITYRYEPCPFCHKWHWVK